MRPSDEGLYPALKSIVEISMKVTKERQQQLAMEYEGGASGQALALKYRMDASTVLRAIRACGATIRPGGSPTKYTIDEAFFDAVDSHEKAQILGFLYADGHLHLKESGFGWFDLSLSRVDEDYLNWVKFQMKSDRPILRYEVSANEVGEPRQFSRFVTNNRVLVRSIQHLGIAPRKSLTLKFPTSGQVPDEFMGSFILGYFEGDGCMNLRKPTAKCATKHGNATMFGSVDFIIGLQNELAKRGIKSTFYPRKTKSGVMYNLCVNTVDDVFALYHLMYDNTTYRMERKHAKFVEYMAQYREVLPTDRFKTDRIHVLKHRNYTDETRARMSALGRAKAIRQFSRDRYLKDRDGRVFQFNVVRDFIDDTKLHKGSVYDLLGGRRAEFKGWTLPTEFEIEAARQAGTLIDRTYRAPDVATVAPIIPIAPPAASTTAA